MSFFQQACASLNRRIHNHFITAPLDVSSSAVQLADTFSAIEALRDAHTHNKKRVSLGAKVTLEDRLTGEVADFTLVEEKESALESGELSHLSPLGVRLIGRKAGDQISMRFMGCRIHVQILEVEYN